MRALALAALVFCLTAPAQAQSRDDRYFVAWGGMGPDVVKAIEKQRHQTKPVKRKAKKSKVHRRYQTAPLTLAGGFMREGRAAVAAIIGGRPAGCPSRFCGCGASLHLFGRIIPSLNLAANWLRFPRAAPGTDMVAARPGHVFVLKRHITGTMWLVFDANSGGHRTRIHPRSIAGYVIVNPRGRA